MLTLHHIRKTDIYQATNSKSIHALHTYNSPTHNIYYTCSTSYALVCPEKCSIVHPKQLDTMYDCYNVRTTQTDILTTAVLGK